MEFLYNILSTIFNLASRIGCFLVFVATFKGVAETIGEKYPEDGVLFCGLRRFLYLHATGATLCITLLLLLCVIWAVK